ncbi:MAG: M20/M25/M40 family metallo-hydrolase [Synergistaceae bacterium]|jgi:acetylornithine deacetylase|nr:M20/M25/M40 family metallo-hydrolase [Synergistaceae bacterium]
MSYSGKIVDLIGALVAIDSSNAFLIPGSPGERKVQEFILGYLTKLGLEAKIEPTNDGHTNLAACFKGIGGGKNITLYAHADTVGYELWRDRALKLDRRGDTLVGLGAADDKGHCAAAILAVERLIEEGCRPRGDVNLAFVADEEGRSAGAFGYVRDHTPETALILESAPVERINVTHQGFGWLDITVKGKAAHGSAPGEGRDAIARMAEIIVRLQKLAREKYAAHSHPLNGETVYHTGTITGGTDYGTYPEHCKLGIEIGTQPGETIKSRVDEIEEIFEQVRTIYPDLDASVGVTIARDPFEARGHEEIYAAYEKALAKVTGKTAVAVGENSWGDAQIFQDAGFPTIGVGADGGNLHAPDEWVSLSELEELVEVVAETIKDYCG